VDPQIFEDPDPESQNFADPTDPDSDPKHYFTNKIMYSANVLMFSINPIQADVWFTQNSLGGPGDPPPSISLL